MLLLVDGQPSASGGHIDSSPTQHKERRDE